jgi:hypothetical protein
VRAHRRAPEHGALDAAVVEHREQVGGERLVAVVLGRRRRGRAPVAARVVEDDAVAASLQCSRPHHDVAARGGEPVEQDDRDALAGLLPSQRRAGALHGELGHAR